MWCHLSSYADDSDIPPPPPPTQGRFEIVLDNDMIARLDLTPAHDILQKYVGLDSLGEMPMRIFFHIDYIFSNIIFNSLAVEARNGGEIMTMLALLSSTKCLRPQALIWWDIALRV